MSTARARRNAGIWPGAGPCAGQPGSSCDADHPSPAAPHLALPLGSLAGRRLAGRAPNVVLARPQVLAALWAKLQLRAVATLLARAAHVGRRAEVHLQPPQLRKGAVAACRKEGGGGWVSRGEGGAGPHGRGDDERPWRRTWVRAVEPIRVGAHNDPRRLLGRRGIIFLLRHRGARRQAKLHLVLPTGARGPRVPAPLLALAGRAVCQLESAQRRSRRPWALGRAPRRGSWCQPPRRERCRPTG